jgi:hypothetical protein
MVQKFLVGAGLATAVTLMVSASAWAQPNPNPNAPAHVGTACENVIARNPNTGANVHMSDTAAANFAAVGAAMCGLEG